MRDSKSSRVQTMFEKMFALAAMIADGRYRLSPFRRQQTQGTRKPFSPPAPIVVTAEMPTPEADIIEEAAEGLLRVGLGDGCGVGESRDSPGTRIAILREDDRIRGHVGRFEATHCFGDLGDEADIGHAGRIAIGRMARYRQLFFQNLLKGGWKVSLTKCLNQFGNFRPVGAARRERSAFRDPRRLLPGGDLAADHLGQASRDPGPAEGDSAGSSGGLGASTSSRKLH